MAIQSNECLDQEGRQYHIKCRKGDIGRYVLVPGDPFRTDIIASYLDNAVLIAHNREHKTWTGYLDGVKVSVTSTGMGGPSTAIAIEELIHCGAEVFIRVGTCGRICEESFNPAYEGVILTGAIRDEGTTVHYIPIEYPAVADLDVTNALLKAAGDLNYNFARGIAQSKDAFYGQTDPASMPDSQRLLNRWAAWEKAGVMASEMEASTLFVVSSIRGCRAGALMAYGFMNEHCIEVACRAIRNLIAQEKQPDELL